MNLPTACLPLLAALTPDDHRMTLVDENVEPIDYDRLAKADIVGLTGMVVQRHRMREILRELKARGVFTVVAVRGSACRRTTSTNLGPQLTVTTDMHIRYYRQPKGGPLIAEAKMVHRGRRLLSAECTVLDASDRVLSPIDCDVHAC
jgi:hypothetical protein